MTRPRRIRGRRWLLVEVTPAEVVLVWGLFRSHEIAALYGCDIASGVVVDVDAVEAGRIVRSPWARSGGLIDETKLSELGAVAAVDIRTLRREFWKETATGSGLIARSARRKLKRPFSTI